MKSDTPSYRGYRFPPEIISHGVWLYHRVPQAHKTLDAGCVIRKKEDHVLTGRQPWELRSCELVFASVEVLHSVAAGPPTQ